MIHQIIIQKSNLSTVQISIKIHYSFVFQIVLDMDLLANEVPSNINNFTQNKQQQNFQFNSQVIKTHLKKELKKSSCQHPDLFKHIRDGIIKRRTQKNQDYNKNIQNQISQSSFKLKSLALCLIAFEMILIYFQLFRNLIIIYKKEESF